MNGKILLGLGALTTCAALAAACLLRAPQDTARAADARPLAAASREPVTSVVEPLAAAPQPLRAGDSLRALSGTVSLDQERTVAAAQTPEEKALAKLDKKLNKAQTKQAKAELKLAKLADKLAALQAELDQAEADGDEAAIAKLAKKVAKKQAKIDKQQAKLDAAETTVAALQAEILGLDPDHFEDVEGLQAPETMQVVTADDGGGGAQSFWGGGGGSGLLGEGDFPPFSDFNLDPVQSHVFDPSMEVLSTVDMILCFLAGTAYDAMVNQGLYVAQVDEGACESGSDGGGEQGQSSGAGAEQPSLFTVKCERATGDAEQLVSLWVPFGGPDDDAAMQSVYVRAKLTVFEGISESDPFGKFKMDFAAVPPGGELADPLMHGTLMTLDVLDGFIGFSFHFEEGDLDAEEMPPGSYAELVQANVNMFDDQSEGVARVHREWRENFGQGDTGVQVEESLLAFDDDSVLRGTTGLDTQCLSRTEFETQVFRYTLYEAAGENAGARVERNGGFSVQTADGAWGWAGYYGLWLPPEAEDDLQSGDTVTEATFGPDAGEPAEYTVLMAPGKLIRNTRQQLALADADGESFEWWEFPGMGPPPGGDPPPEGDPPPGDPPPFTPPTHWRVEYHHDTGEFLKVATFDEVTQTWTDEPSPEPVDLVAQPFLGMFSQSLGGSVSYVAGDEHLTYFQQTFVNQADELFGQGDDVPLYGYFDCLQGQITTEQAESGDVFQDNAYELASPHRYLMRGSDMTLWLDEEGDQSNLVACTLVEGAEPATGPFAWGMRTGPLVLDTSGLLDTYEVWNQEVFYTWETGANSWNKLSILIDAEGVAVSFDPPLQFTYEHSVENDVAFDPTYAGDKFLLQYNGPGDLFGIPMEAVDLDGDGSPDRFYPLFSISDGVLMGPEGTEYAVKAIDKELTLLDADPSLCADQTVDPVAALPLPDGSEYQAPAIGPKPLVDEPPAVIDGVVQVPAEP